MKLKFLIPGLMLLGAMKLAAATDYYVSPTVTDGYYYHFNEHTYTGGTTAFRTIGEALALATSGSKIHVQPGTYSETLNITTENIELLGANAWGDSRSSTRINAESVITGQINIKASKTTVNGFRFTGAARVVSTWGTADTPVNYTKFLYNKVDNLTSERTDSQAFFRLGSIYNGSDAKKAENVRRYGTVTVSHNEFSGNSTHMAFFVLICNAFGHIDILDNTFTDGGRPICVANTQGYINIDHNLFSKIGASKLTFGTTTGEYAIVLRNVAPTQKVTMSVCHNTFTNCQGQSKGYYPVFLNQGADSDNVAATAGSTMKFSHNVIKNFNYTDGQGSSFNYFFFTNSTNSKGIVTDTRFNRCENSEVAFGVAPPAWSPNASERYFSGSQGKFDFAGSKGTTADYYACPNGTKLHNYRLANNYGLQSFDIDEETGDIYFVQLNADENGSTAPLRVTRYLFRDDKTTGRQYMYLTNASHGANLAVFRKDGKLWISTGGASVYDGHAKPQSCVFLPFVSGATANCADGKTSFSYGGTTYPIIQFKNQWGKTGCYPAIDRHNRLFCEAHSVSGGTRYAIYDLDDVLANGSNATCIKTMRVDKGSNKYTNSDAAYADIVKKDDGFSTSGWAMQGFTIYGDHIYNMSGMGRHSTYAYTYGGTKIPAVMQDCFNWRDSVYVYRKPILNTKWRDAPNGEPEGVKFIRDANGRPHMICGMNWGVPDYRTVTLIDFTPPSGDHIGYSYSIPKADLSSKSEPANFSAVAIGETVKKNAKVELNKCIGEPTATISGPDAACFALGDMSRSGNANYTYTFPVLFTPDMTKKNYEATLRISAPNASDVFMKLKGTYGGAIQTSVETIDADASNVTVAAYYDTNGNRLSSPLEHGITIVRYSDGTSRKILRR